MNILGLVSFAAFVSSAQNLFNVTGRANGTCRLATENVLVRRLVEPSIERAVQRAVLELRHCTFENLEIDVSGVANWDNCLVKGTPSSEEATGADAESLEKLRELLPNH